MARRSREVNIFHFSFLDILFNTVGAIVFMFMIYAVMTNDLVEENSAARKQLEDTQQKVTQSAANVEQLEKKSKNLQQNLEKIKKEIEESRKDLELAKSDIVKQKIKLSKKDKTINQLKKKVESLSKGTGIDSELDTAVMAEWGESGGSEATRVTTQIVGENTESVIISGEGEKVFISGVPFFDLENISHWARYFDSQNQKMQFLTSLESEGVSGFKDYFGKLSSAGNGLISLPDSNVPLSMNGQESISFDSDGDGVADHIYSDLDLDGKADKLQKDTDGDGEYDELFFHYDEETKRWKTKLVDPNKDGRYDMALMDTDITNDHYEIKLVDFDPRTGKARIKYEDQNGDGLFDRKWVDTDLEDDDWEEVYSDMDPGTKKWTKISMDTNNDGVPDVVLKDTDLSNDSFEEKMVDSDYDGVFDSRWMDMEPEDSDWEAQYCYLDEGTGFWKEVFFDTSGNGNWDVHGINSDLKNERFEVLLKDEDGDGKFEVKLEDLDGDSVYENRFEDRDLDGKYEISLKLDTKKEEYVEVK